jgi:hypothetical protein
MLVCSQSIGSGSSERQHSKVIHFYRVDLLIFGVFRFRDKQTMLLVVTDVAVSIN